MLAESGAVILPWPYISNHSGETLQSKQEEEGCKVAGKHPQTRINWTANTQSIVTI